MGITSLIRKIRFLIKLMIIYAKKLSKRNKWNYYQLKGNEKLNMYIEQRVSAEQTYRYYWINKGIWDGPLPRKFEKNEQI